mgnify:CR=1 FL=1
MQSVRKVRDVVLTTLFVTMMVMLFAAILKGFTEVMWPVTTLAFAAVGTVYACKRWTTGALALVGISLYVAAWMFKSEMSAVSCSAIASGGVGMWFTALCWPTLSRRSVTTPGPN